MRRYALAVTAVVSLGLVACGSSDNADNNNDGTITAADAAPSEENTSEEGGAVELNKPFEISKLDDNDVFLTIKEITLGEDCTFGVYAPEYRNDELEGQQYLQILAEVDVQKLDNPQSGGLVYLNDVKAVDGDGYAKVADSAQDCKAGEDYESWFTPTDPGDKSRRYGAFLVPKDVTEVRVEGRVYAVK